jgi:hypothetical protein
LRIIPVSKLFNRPQLAAQMARKLIHPSALDESFMLTCGAILR